MSTVKVIIDKTPQQITDGSVTAYITSSDAFYFADSPVAPTDLTAGHRNTELSVNPPFQIWAWHPTKTVVLVVTSQTA